MIVFVTGATGFLGRHLVAALLATGHEVVCAGRHVHPAHGKADRIRWVPADFRRDFSPADWANRLAGVDVVVNCVGILREHGTQTFEALHTRAPQALFTACVSCGVHRVIQVSALGADEGARSRYHLSKKAADDFLASLPLAWTIVQPSLVYGPGGTSAKLFTMLASMPCVPVPGRGEQAVQPVHVEDVIAAMMVPVGSAAGVHQRIPLVGPVALPLRDFLGGLRTRMDLRRPCYINIPMSLVRAGSRIGTMLPGSLLDTESLGMLMRGNTADPELITGLLGHAPRPVEEFIPRQEAAAVRTVAKLHWLLPVLRWSVAIVWIVTGIVSFGVYPTSASYDLLARTGVTGPLAPILLHGAAALDLFFGAAVLTMRKRRLLWTAQLVLILGYTLIITIRLPEFWVHPYGPLVKNLPMLAAIWLLRELEDAPKGS